MPTWSSRSAQKCCSRRERWESVYEHRAAQRAPCHLSASVPLLWQSFLQSLSRRAAAWPLLVCLLERGAAPALGLHRQGHAPALSLLPLPAHTQGSGKRASLSSRTSHVIPNVPCHPESAHVILSASEGSHPAKEGRVCPAGARGAGRHSHIAALVLDPSPSLSLRATAHALRMTGTAALRTIEPILIGTLHQGGHRHLWHLSQRGVSRSRSSRRPIRWKAPPVPLLIPRRLLNARARRSWRSLYPCPWRRSRCGCRRERATGRCSTWPRVRATGLWRWRAIFRAARSPGASAAAP